MTSTSDGERGMDPDETMRVDGAPTLARDQEPRKDDDAQPDRVGRFVILRRLGRGGMGVVYSAYDEDLDRKLAIKFVHPGRGGEGASGRARLLREAQAMARLNHPNVVTVHDVGEHEGRVFVAMEFVKGMTLREWMAEDHSWQEIRRILLSAGRGLVAAHAQGLVHRDFKPENVLVADDGNVLVTDFGLARTTGLDDASILRFGDDTRAIRKESAPHADHLATPLTEDGSLSGTPLYMAPEQFQGEPTDARTDQFAFCIALYEALYGERPFRSDSLPTLARAVTDGDVSDPPRGSKVPRWLRRVLLRGLAIAPGHRWPDMEALLAQLQRDPGRNRRLAMAGVVLVGGLGVGGYLQATQPSPCESIPEHLAGTWDVPTRQTLRQAVIDSGVPDGEATWRRLSRAIDIYTAGWVSHRTEACKNAKKGDSEAMRLAHFQAACLERRLSELGAVVQVIAQGDEKVINRAVTAVTALQAPRACRDPAVVRSELPEPTDPAAAAAVQEIRELMDRGTALKLAGKYAEGVEVMQRAYEAAQGSGYPAIVPETRYRLGDLQGESGDYKEARAHLESAFWAAVGLGDDKTAARSAAGVVYVHGYKQAAFEAGLRWSKQAEAFIKRVRLPDLERASLLTNKGLVLDEMSEFEEARQAHQEALEIFERDLGPEHLRVATALTNLGNVAGSEGATQDALRHYQRALRIFETSLGPNHPKTALGLTNLGTVLTTLGEYDEALRVHRRALEIRKATLGNDHTSVAETLVNIGSALHEKKRDEEAEAHYLEALGIIERAHGPEHPHVAYTLINLANMLGGQDKPGEALPYNKRALEILEKALGPKHPNLGYPLTAIGKNLTALKRPRKALAPLKRALELREAKKTPDMQMAFTRFALANALWDSGKNRKRAIQLARQAAANYTRAGKASTEPLAEVEAWIAEREK
jgi:tetratricopeptide (TPR) repeat protein/predicted Ser/Thr protein kinase